MKCHSGLHDFPCRICARSRGFARFAARVPRALDRAQNRRHWPELRGGGETDAGVDAKGVSAIGGMGRQFATKSGMGSGSEPERARLKLTHPGVRNALSARPFCGVSCRKMWHPILTGFSMNTVADRAPNAAQPQVPRLSTPRYPAPIRRQILPTRCKPLQRETRRTR